MTGGYFVAIVPVIAGDLTLLAANPSGNLGYISPFEKMTQADFLCLLYTPGREYLAPHPIPELCFAFQHEDFQAIISQDFGNPATCQPTSHNNHIVVHNQSNPRMAG